MARDGGAAWYLRELGVAPPASPRVAVGAVEVLLADYRVCLAVERALTVDTIACTRCDRSSTVSCVTAMCSSSPG